jgi:hypothetical protein
MADKNKVCQETHTPLRAVSENSTALWENPENPQEEEADVDLSAVEFTTQRVSTKYSPRGAVGKKYIAKNSQKWFPTVYLITHEQSVTTVRTTEIGPTPLTVLDNHQQWMISCHKKSSNGDITIDIDTQAQAACLTCSFTNTGAQCTLALNCEGWYHKRCNINKENTMCTLCHSDNTAPEQKPQLPN